MNKHEALETIQTFLDKSSHHKWKEIQECIDYLKDKTLDQSPRWKPYRNLTDRETVQIWVDMHSPLNKPEFERHLLFIQDKLKEKNIE